MTHDIALYLGYFFVYGMLGWVAEVAFAAVKSHGLVNRGFLNGPICPIYGVGMAALVLLLHPYTGNFWAVFIGGAVITSLIELFGGWALYKIFHARWWDYSDKPGNLGGYICPQFSLLWGLGSVVMLKLIHPPVAAGLALLPPLALYIVDGILVVGLAVDVGVSAADAIGLNKYLAELDSLRAAMRTYSDKLTEVIGTNAMNADQLLDEQRLNLALAKLEGKESAAELRRQFDEELAPRLRAVQQQAAKAAKYKFFGLGGFGRLLKAFPKMQSVRYGDTLNHLRERLEATAQQLKDKLSKPQ